MISLRATAVAAVVPELQSEHLRLSWAQHTYSRCRSRLIDRPSTPVGGVISPAPQLCCCCRRLFRCCRRPMSWKGPTGGSGVTRPSVILWYTRVESEATAHSSIGKPLSSTRRILHKGPSGDLVKFGKSVRDKDITTREETKKKVCYIKCCYFCICKSLFGK